LSKKKSHKSQPKRHAKGPKPPRHPKGKGFSSPRRTDLPEIVGTVQATDRGFGFLIPENGSPDAFIPPREMQNIMQGDTVRARVMPDRFEPNRFRAEILGVVKRGQTTLVGTLFLQHNRLLLKPDDPKIPLVMELTPSPVQGKVGEKALAQITRWPSATNNLEGRIVEALGKCDGPGMDMRLVILKHHWPERFDPAAERQAEALPPNPSGEDFAHRLDLRGLPILTIDGRDARDFDDAISLERTDSGGWRLGVHIADVSHYVRPESPLDLSAKGRATSLYLPDRVLPMFPHSLSDGLCSLREGVPRLTMSAFLEYDAAGHPTKTHFAPSVILSRRRGIYEEVQKALDGNADLELRRKYDDLVPMLRDMSRLSGLIRARREKNGALDFDLPEVRAVIDEQGEVLDVKRVARLGTHKLIEDFMVAANEAVADFLWKRKMPALYRIHEPPTAKDSADLVALLKAYRVPFRENELGTPKGLQDLLKRVKGHPLEATINTLALRSLTMAVYSPKNAGHFGLGLKSYCHFTSPIRRYPDVVVHRALKRALDFPGGQTEKDVEALGRHTSFQERAAEKAEREGQKVKQLGFMSKKIGFETQGRVTHVTANGAFVEMDPWGIEGFVPSEAFPGGPYQYDEIHLRLTGKKGQVKLGDTLKVKVDTVDMMLQRLTLKPIG
jgi:ribonuclease R